MFDGLDILARAMHAHRRTLVLLVLALTASFWIVMFNPRLLDLSETARVWKPAWLPMAALAASGATQVAFVVASRRRLLRLALIWVVLSLGATCALSAMLDVADRMGGMGSLRQLPELEPPSQLQMYVPSLSMVAPPAVAATTLVTFAVSRLRGRDASRDLLFLLAGLFLCFAICAGAHYGVRYRAWWSPRRTVAWGATVCSAFLVIWALLPFALCASDAAAHEPVKPATQGSARTGLTPSLVALATIAIFSLGLAREEIARSFHLTRARVAISALVATDALKQNENAETWRKLYCEPTLEDAGGGLLSKYVSGEDGPHGTFHVRVYVDRHALRTACNAGAHVHVMPEVSFYPANLTKDSEAWTMVVGAHLRFLPGTPISYQPVRLGRPHGANLAGAVYAPAVPQHELASIADDLGVHGDDKDPKELYAAVERAIARDDVKVPAVDVSVPRSLVTLALALSTLFVLVQARKSLRRALDVGSSEEQSLPVDAAGTSELVLATLLLLVPFVAPLTVAAAGLTSHAGKVMAACSRTSLAYDATALLLVAAFAIAGVRLATQVVAAAIALRRVRMQTPSPPPVRRSLRTRRAPKGTATSRLR